MKVAKWGNSLAVRLPADMVEALGLKEGDEIAIVPGESRLAVVRIPDRLELLQEMRRYRGMRPADYKFNRNELYDREPGDEN
jgi:antitoxin MazE